MLFQKRDIVRGVRETRTATCRTFKIRRSTHATDRIDRQLVEKMFVKLTKSRREDSDSMVGGMGQ